MRDLELKQVLIAFVVLLGGSTLIGYGLNQLGVGKVGIPKCEDEKTKTLIKSIYWDVASAALQEQSKNPQLKILNAANVEVLQSNFDIEIRTVIENEYEKGKAYSCEADFYLHGKDAASKEFISKLAKKSAALREIIIFGSDLNTISMPTDGSKDEFIRVAKGILTMIKLAETPNLPSPLDFLKATGLDVAWLSAPVGLYAYNKIGFEATTAIGSYFDELNKSAPVIVNEESFKTKVHFTSSLKNVDGSLRQVVAARFDDNLGAIPLQFSALKNRYLNGKNLLMQIMPQLEGANSKETRG